MSTFVFRPNWADGVLERLEWLNEVLISHGGYEQRMSWRSFPRRTLEYTILVSGNAAARLDAFLWAYQSTKLEVPVWVDEQRVASDLSIGTLNIPCDTTYCRFHEKGKAILMQDVGMSTYPVYEVVTIEQVNVGSIDLYPATTKAWPKNSWLLPVYDGWMTQSSDVQRLTGDVARASFQFQLENVAFTPTDSETKYLSDDVLLRDHNWTDEMTVSYNRKAATIDSSMGPIAIYDQSGISVPVHTIKLSLFSKESACWLRNFLHLREGSKNAFWFPTGNSDLVQSGACGSGSTSFPVQSVDYLNTYNYQDGRKDIAMFHKDGTNYFRRISTVSPSGSNDVLTLDSALGVDTDVGSFKRISWLMQGRLAADAIEISWKTSKVAESTFDVTGVGRW